MSEPNRGAHEVASGVATKRTIDVPPWRNNRSLTVAALWETATHFIYVGFAGVNEICFWRKMCGFIGVFEDFLLDGCERTRLDRMNRIDRILSRKSPQRVFWSSRAEARDD